LAHFVDILSANRRESDRNEATLEDAKSRSAASATADGPFGREAEDEAADVGREALAKAGGLVNAEEGLE